MKHRILFLVMAAIVALTTTAVAQDKATIRFTRWAGSQEAKDFKALVKKFTDTHPGIEVKTEFLPWAAYWEKVRTTVIGGDSADVVSLSNLQSAPYITKGAFMKLDDQAALKEVFAKLSPSAVDAAEYAGNTYAVPVGLGIKSLIYNKDLLQKAGIPFPDPVKPMTWDQFVAMAKKLTVEQNGKVVQYAARFHPFEYWESLIYQAGGKIVDNLTNPSKFFLTSPEAITGLNRYKQLLDEKIIPAHTGDWSGPFGTPDSAVATGKVAFMISGPWSLANLEPANIKYGTAPVPMDKKRATVAYVNSLAISKNTKNLKAALEFVKWMASYEGQMEFTKTGDLPTNLQAIEKLKVTSKGTPLEAFFEDLPYGVMEIGIPSDELLSMFTSVLTDFYQRKLTTTAAAEKISAQGAVILKKVFGR